MKDAGTDALKRTLGPTQLVALGIGAIIGAGLFSLTGIAASQNAGPAVVLSFVLAAVGCAFAGLCYSEFATMIPIAGSAYTYAYATLGEIFAWIIGWDLILEYAVGNEQRALVAHAHRARVGDAAGVDLDLEAFRHFEVADRQLFFCSRERQRRRVAQLLFDFGVRHIGTARHRGRYRLHRRNRFGRVSRRLRLRNRQLSNGQKCGDQQLRQSSGHGLHLVSPG